MGVLGITGIPFWNGYISKTLIHESIVEYIVILQETGQSATYMIGVEWLFLFSGGLTVAYMVKLFVAVFMEDNPYTTYDETKPYMTKVSAVVLTVSAVIPVILGTFPHGSAEVVAELSYEFMNAHAPDHTIHYFAWVNLKGAVISVTIGMVVYFLFIRQVLMRKDENGNKIYIDCWPEWLSLENKVYRPVLLMVLPYVGGFFARLAGSFGDGMVALLRMGIFNNDKSKVIPPEDRYFSTYKEYEGEEKLVYREGFARNLLIIGLGLAIAMIYILI